MNGDLTRRHKDVTSQHKDLTCQHNDMTSEGRNYMSYIIFKKILYPTKK